MSYSRGDAGSPSDGISSPLNHLGRERQGIGQGKTEKFGTPSAFMSTVGLYMTRYIPNGAEVVMLGVVYVVQGLLVPLGNKI